MSKLVKNSALYFITDTSVKLAQFLLLPLYTTLITPEQFGNIYLLVSLSNFLTIFISIAMHGAISRYYFSYKTLDGVIQMYSWVIKFIFIFCTPIYVILILLGDNLFEFLNLEFYPYGLMSLITSYLSIYYLNVTALLQASQNAKKLSYVTIISSILSLIITVILVIHMKDKVFAFLLSLLLTALVNFVIFIVFSVPYFRLSGKATDKKKYIAYALSRLPVDVSSMLVTFADRFMIYEMKGEKATGIYSVGYRMGQVIQLVFYAINRAYVPYVFEKFSNNDNLQTISKVATKLFGLYFFISSVAIVFTKELVLLLDASYQDSYLVIILILLSYLFLALKLLFQPPMDFKVEFVKVKSFLWILTSIVNILLNVWLIPIYSLYGAALATFITYLLMLFPIVYYANKAIPIKYDIKKIIKLTVISLIYLSLLVLEVSFIAFGFKVILTILYFLLMLRVIGIRMSELIFELKKLKKNNRG